MPTCKGKLSNGDPCPITVAEDQDLCKWHNPDCEGKREIYDDLKKSMYDIKTRHILLIINEHPEHRLELPECHGEKADLSYIDLSPNRLLEIITENPRSKENNQLPIWWWDSQLESINLCRADLRGADLRKANLCRANLEGANLRGAILREAQLQGANLREAQLQGADLRKANLDKADLEGAELQHANLSRANLFGAYLGGLDE